MENGKSILVLTDEPLVAIGIRALLSPDPEFRLLDICGNYQELIAAARMHQPDVVVCGLSGEADLRSLGELQAAAPRSGIVLWAREISNEIAHQAVEQGVRGFLGTTSAPGQFRECLGTVARGELWMESSLTMSLLNNRPISLSRRQSELIGLLVQGLKNKEIAATLGISEGTVKAYLTTLYEKVGARDRFELALFGLRNMGQQPGGKLPVKPLRSVITQRNLA